MSRVGRRAIAAAFIALLGALRPGSTRAEDTVPSKPPAASTAPAPVAGLVRPSTPEEAADAVLAAVKAKDDAALKALAAKDDPDPWRVVDELIARGRLDAADAFAKAAPRADTAALPAYVAVQAAAADDVEARTALRTVNTVLARGDAAGVLALTVADGPLATVTTIRFRFARALALRQLRREAEAAAPLGEVAAAAESVGWLARSVFALHLRGWDAFVRGDVAAARAAWTHREALESRRGVPSGGALAASSLGSLEASVGAFDRAVELKTRAVALYEVAGDVVAAAHERIEVADAHGRAGRVVLARDLLDRVLGALEATGPTAVRMRARDALASLSWQTGQFSAALEAGRGALSDAEALGDEAMTAQSQANVGIALVALARYDEGAAAHQRALALHEARGDRSNAAREQANLARIAALRGRLGEGLAGLSVALRTAVAAATAGEAEASAAQAQIHGMTALVQTQIGDLGAALQHDRAALALLDPVRDRNQRAHIVSHIGQTYLARGDVSRALESFDDAAAAYRAVGNLSGVASMLVNLGGLAP